MEVSGAAGSTRGVCGGSRVGRSTEVANQKRSTISCTCAYLPGSFHRLVTQRHSRPDRRGSGTERGCRARPVHRPLHQSRRTTRPYRSRPPATPVTALTVTMAVLRTSSWCESVAARRTSSSRSPTPPLARLNQLSLSNPSRTRPHHRTAPQPHRPNNKLSWRGRIGRTSAAARRHQR
jgi:hypothetical protein